MCVDTASLLISSKASKPFIYYKRDIFIKSLYFMCFMLSVVVPQHFSDTFLGTPRFGCPPCFGIVNGQTDNIFKSLDFMLPSLPVPKLLFHTGVSPPLALRANLLAGISMLGI